ncbi:type VI secretion system baseplate subunit TssF [Microbulbifer thermotolerans]|uniref:Type VI secretion system baseplate subunit TssF n=1 Tax=Microbulbifer thermotolerans TaxID=252514 RepID=A0AB35HTC0_MICTH|nr:type VI secretion system baseplate subunit TssF [Microbulbifer thermotolerans]MCX2800273.1 type VI secretion system baseplate subunit TssF [Microbulbifer thermotolerans]
MSEKLIDLYERELAFVQQTAAEFARMHPAAASRLQLDTDTVDDPLVGRLMSGFAYLNARVQQKLSDDFPELTDAMLETLYPHYLRPIPSCAVVQFEPESDLDAIVRVDANTLLETESFQGQTCRFTSRYPVDICPFQAVSASLMPRPFIAPGCNEIQSANAVLKLSLKTQSPDLNFSEIKPGHLRFFLRGQPSHVYALYDLLLSKCVKLVVANGEADPHPTYLEPHSLQPVGLDPDQGLLPYPDTAFIGYRLLTEYFAFPEKFHFIDINGLEHALNDSYGDSLNLYFYLSENHDELEKQLTPGMFVLGCTPVVNLFPQTADPIPLTHAQYNYHVVPDARRSDGLEIYSIDSVTATDGSGKSTSYRPFYGIQHSQHHARQTAFWFSRRREVIEGEHRNEQASEVDICLVDLEFNPHKISDQTLDIQLTCCNRNLPKKLPSGNAQPYLEIVDGDAPARRISCVVSPTATLRPPRRERGYWRLISHLNLNHLSLSANGGCEALKEIFRLYDFRDSASTRNLIESLQKVSTRPITAPIQIDHSVVLCRGTEVKIELDPMMLTGTSPLLFASVIERFLGLYCSLNSFTRLIATISGRDGELKRWPPRAGDKALL